MLTRVSDNMKFQTMVDNMFKAQTQYASLEEKLATEKQVNRPSDDPVGMGKILDYRSTQAGITKYQTNVDSCTSWLNMTESKLSSMQDLVVNAKEIAIAQATGTCDASTRQTAAASLQPVIDELLSLANSKLGDRYLFSGSRMDVDPFSSTLGNASVGSAETASGNSFDGTVATGGTYTGTSNKTYVVKIVTGGTLANATYSVSSDGGKTWGSEQTDLDTGTITLGDGITMTFADSGATHLSAGDIFYTQALTAGYYSGNGDALKVETGKGIQFNYNITGEESLTGQGSGVSDLFATLNNFKTALNNNDVSGIQNAINNLEKARSQISQYVSECGTRTNSLDITKTNLTSLNDQIGSLKSGIEDADMASLVTDFSMKQVALQATYSLAGQISKLSILNFIS